VAPETGEIMLKSVITPEQEMKPLIDEITCRRMRENPKRYFWPWTLQVGKDFESGLRGVANDVLRRLLNETARNTVIHRP
jgi:hypothetical protein